MPRGISQDECDSREDRNRPVSADSDRATMRAAVVTELGEPVTDGDVELPVPGPGQALVKLETSGVCHTELHAAHGDWPVEPRPPFVPGHEGYGVVVAVGEGVTDREVGDQVGNAWLWSACVRCEYCRTGREKLCENQTNGGYRNDGSFGSYMLMFAAYAPRIPDETDPLEVAPILCAGVTVYKGSKATDTRPGQWVAIFGIGGLGHVAAQYARAMGLRVVAVDVDRATLDLARRLGAEVSVDGHDRDPVAEVQRQTGGVHGVLVTAMAPEPFSQATGFVRRGGTIVLVGLPPGDFPLPISDVVRPGLTVRGAIVGTLTAMAVGSIVGSGVVILPRRFGSEAECVRPIGRRRWRSRQRCPRSRAPVRCRRRCRPQRHRCSCRC